MLELISIFKMLILGISILMNGKNYGIFCLILREVHHDGVRLHPLTKPDVVGPGLGVWIWLELG